MFAMTNSPKHRTSGTSGNWLAEVCELAGALILSSRYFESGPRGRIQ